MIMMGTVLTSVVLFCSVLFPAKTWYAPDQAMDIRVKAEGKVSLVLTNFTGKTLEPKTSTEVEGEKSLDIRGIYPQLSIPGTYVLYAVPQGKRVADFVGTPLVIEVRQNLRRGAMPGPMVVKIEPLCYAVMNTEQGSMKMVFYYDVAPNTADNFLSLAQGGYFDGLTFHRIVPGFVIQGGDPTGTGTGGPGYNIDAEFNDRLHEEGVLSMARSGDPLEAPGVMPRPEFANSAGSQFFICLDYAATRQLDHRYTAFGKVVEGMDVVKKIAQSPLADQRTGKPVNPPVIQKVEVKAVTAGENPYAAIMKLRENEPAPATTQSVESR